MRVVCKVGGRPTCDKSARSAVLYVAVIPVPDLRPAIGPAQDRPNDTLTPSSNRPLKESLVVWSLGSNTIAVSV